MTNIDKNFERSISLYQDKGPFLPPKIYWKLDLILYMIKGNQPNKDVLSLEQQLQFQDLQNLDIPSLKLVFNNIIQTLFSNSKVETIKCQIKKRGMFASWISACILHNKANLLITYSNKTYTFEKAHCDIRKSKQNKRAFELYFQNSHKYSIKFETQEKMKSILHSWQKELIQSKSHKNYQEMKTLAFQRQQPSTFMQKIDLFSISPPKSSLSPKSNTGKSISNGLNPSLSFLGSSSSKKKSIENDVNLKPVPYGFASKLKSDRLMIAMSKDDKAKIYIEYYFAGKIQQKRLLSLFLLQKSWNSYLVMEYIQKSQNNSNQIGITRKYDSLKQLGQFAEQYFIATYSSLGPNMSMITVDNIEDINTCESLHSKCVITLESQNNKSRILIQEQLNSKKYDTEKLKRVLFEMYRQIIKLDLIHDKIAIRDFDAETIIANMLEDQDSTNTQSQQDIQLINKISFQQPDGINELLDQESTQRNNQEKKVKLLPCSQVLRLKSPRQYPNHEYIKLIKNKEFEKHYYKFYFPQEFLTEYDDYIPSYRIDRMIQDKIYEITPSRELKFIDQELLDSQKEILRFVLRQIGANIISGKSILNVSLPVDIFESRTGLQRGAAAFGCCPDYLIPRAYSPPLQQLQYVIGFMNNVVSTELVMQKPFNPILGQTFQGYIKGIPIYYEQTFHSPPISSYFMKCDEFTLYGNLIPFADVGLNTGVGGNLGPVNIKFANGTHFECYFPPSEISGLIYGDRKFRCYNKSFIFQKNTQLYAQFSIQNQKKGVYQSPTKLKGGQIIGGIYKVKPQFIEEIQRYRKQHKNLKKFGGLTKDYIIEKYNTITGEWFSKIFMDGKAINDNMTVYPVQYAKNVLPSDSNFRLDVLYHKMKDLSHSQKEKQILQIIQRNDRKLREKGSFTSH